MKNEEIVLIGVILLILLILYFVTARGPAKKITITNPDGSEVSVSVEIANSTATRMKGLMGRKSLGGDEGMLFVFDRPSIYSFWMVNTTIPLDGVFIAENGTVVDIIEMAPCGWNITDCPHYIPKAPAKYVLEVNRGFCAEHGIQTGKSRVIQ